MTTTPSAETELAAATRQMVEQFKALAAGLAAFVNVATDLPDRPHPLGPHDADDEAIENEIRAYRAWRQGQDRPEAFLSLLEARNPGTLYQLCERLDDFRCYVDSVNDMVNDNPT